MKKIKSLLAGLTLGVCLFTTPVFAADKQETDFKNYFNVTEVSIVKRTIEERNIGEVFLFVLDEEDKDVFPAKEVFEWVYTTENLNVREVPTIESKPVGVLEKNSRVKRVGVSIFGWDILAIADEYFFVYNEYLTTEEPEEYIEVYQIRGDQPGVYSVTSTPSSNNNRHNQSTNSTPNTQYVGIGENAAKEEIARRESGGDYNAVSKTGKYIGRYQLTNTYLNGDYSPENQERVADEYVANRYGSWENALAFHNQHGWY